jgi:hypothetical protein
MLNEKHRGRETRRKQKKKSSKTVNIKEEEELLHAVEGVFCKEIKNKHSSNCRPRKRPA